MNFERMKFSPKSELKANFYIRPEEEKKEKPIFTQRYIDLLMLRVCRMKIDISLVPDHKK